MNICTSKLLREPNHQLASESTFTRSEGSSVVQGAPSHTRRPLGSLESPDKRLAIRGSPFMRSENPSLTQKSEGSPVAQGAPATLPEGPCHAPRGLLPLALKTTGYLRGPLGSDRSEGPCQVLKGTLDGSGPLR